MTYQTEALPYRPSDSEVGVSRLKFGIPTKTERLMLTSILFYVIFSQNDINISMQVETLYFASPVLRVRRLLAVVLRTPMKTTVA